MKWELFWAAVILICCALSIALVVWGCAYRPAHEVEPICLPPKNEAARVLCYPGPLPGPAPITPRVKETWM